MDQIEWQLVCRGIKALERIANNLETIAAIIEAKKAEEQIMVDTSALYDQP